MFAAWTCTQIIETVAEACDPAALLAATDAVLGSGLQALLDVELVMCTDAVAPGAIVPRLQTRVWLPALPVIEQVPGPL